MKYSIQVFMPKLLLTKIAGFLAESKLVFLKNWLIKYFLKKFSNHTNMSEAIEADPYSYESFNAFFTRKLLPDSRIISPDEHSIVSPADGTVAQKGFLTNNFLVHAKGKNFYLKNLLGGTFPEDVFINGGVLTVYLAPYDYHRVHMPVTGKLENMIYVPGKLFSVNKQTTDAVYDLFGRNERVINIFDTQYGKIALILVGAMLVGSIETVWAGAITPVHSSNIYSVNYKNDSSRQILLNKGEEMGHFKMGSTVIVLSEKNSVLWNENIMIDDNIHFGQKIGQFIK